ncbi:MAG: D-alanyl-D-alanine carboxypeptidase, partial [Hungatella hathewayi]|nr:D-alanyl-D-alanine carboxypeptidase [Hungatella hathewayi]
GTEESAAETDPAGSDAETAGTETSASETAGSQDETELPKETEDYREKALRPFEIPSIAWIILGSVAGIILLGALITFLVLRKNREEQEYHFRHEQRLKRLQDSGVSADEFNSLMEQRRSAYTSKRKKGRGNRHLKFK